MTDWLFPYPPLFAGTLIKRYKRFFADILLDSGEAIVAHCPNTGPMTGVYHPGCPVMVSRSASPTRKLPYTWEMIQVPPLPTWVGANTAMPNQVIKAALAFHLFPELGAYTEIRTEVPYGKDKKKPDRFSAQLRRRLASSLCGSEKHHLVSGASCSLP